MRRAALASLALVALTALTAVAARGGAPPPPTSPAALLAAYLRIDTSTGAPGEARAAEWLAGELQRAGLSAIRHLSPDGRTSLSCRLAANATRTGGAVVLLHHLDVVPAGEGWSVPAFGGVTRDGAIWGRGAVDAKGLGIAHLAAFLDAAQSDLPRHRDLVLLATAGEESGGLAGVGWLVSAHPELFADVAVVLNEGGMNRTANDRPLWFGIETAQKRPFWLELVARGRGGHASSLAPESAAHQLVRALARLVDRPPHWRLEEPAASALAAQARVDPSLAAALARLPATLATGTPESSLPPGLLGALDDSLQVTTLAAASSINVIAPEARATVDGRLLPATDDIALLAELRALAGRDVEIRVLLAAPRSQPSPTDSPVFRLLERTLSGEAPVFPAFIPGVTDSRYFRERGIAAYGFSPFALDGTVLAAIHGANERMPERELGRGVERMRRVVRALLAGEPREPSSVDPAGRSSR